MTNNKWHSVYLGNGQKDLPIASCDVMTALYSPKRDDIYLIHNDSWSAKWQMFNCYDSNKTKNNEDYNESVIAWKYLEDEEADVRTAIGAERLAQIRADKLAAEREKEAHKIEFLTVDELEADDEENV